MLSDTFPFSQILILFPHYLFLFPKSLSYSDNMRPSGLIHSPSLERCTANKCRKRHLSQTYHDHVCVAMCIIHFVFETEGINE